MKVGVIGCGTISDTYLNNMTGNHHLPHIEVVACADLYPEKAKASQEKFGIKKACGVDELLSDPEVDIVVNLTIPASHYDINIRALRAGKHVYCEKPLAMNLDETNEIMGLAEEKGLRVGCAPDTILGDGIQACRRAIDEGMIGELVGFTANMCSPGPDYWHPAAGFYYKKGAGPMMDMGPYYLSALVFLMGPVKEVGCFARKGRATRMINGEHVDVEVFTHYAGTARFEAGVMGNINMSFDVWRTDLPLIEIYGTEGTLFVPDPNMFSGGAKVFLKKDIIGNVEAAQTFLDKIMAIRGPESQKAVKELPLEHYVEPGCNMRGLGVSDMARGIMDNRPHRANGDVARHVVEALNAFDQCAESETVYRMTTSCERPQPVPMNLSMWEVG